MSKHCLPPGEMGAGEGCIGQWNLPVIFNILSPPRDGSVGEGRLLLVSVSLVFCHMFSFPELEDFTRNCCTFQGLKMEIRGRSCLPHFFFFFQKGCSQRAQYWDYFFPLAPQLVLILSALYLGMHLTSSFIFRAAGRI